MSELIWILVGFVPGLLVAFWFWRQQRSVSTTGNEILHSLPVAMPGQISKVPGILVPMSGKFHPEQAIKAGIELAKITSHKLYVVYFLEVPRTRSLDNCNDAELETAINLIERAELEAHRAGIKIETNIAKVRNYSLGLVDSILEIPVGIVILQHNMGNTSVNLPRLESVAEAVHNKTGCNVLLVNNHPSTEVLSSPRKILQLENNPVEKVHKSV
jgi:hypothetical protein